MNPNDATNEELRDWLANRNGYTKIEGLWYRQSSVYGDGSELHPIPNTIDAAAKCLPEGWKWDTGTFVWAAWKPGGHMVQVDRTADEATDRFRLAVKAIMAMEEGK